MTVVSISAIRASSRQRTVAQGAGAAVSDGEDVADVVQVQAEGAGSADEGQQLDVVLVIEPVAGFGPLGGGQQAPGLVRPYRLACDSGGLGGFPDSQSWWRILAPSRSHS